MAKDKSKSGMIMTREGVYLKLFNDKTAYQQEILDYLFFPEKLGHTLEIRGNGILREMRVSIMAGLYNKNCSLENNRGITKKFKDSFGDAEFYIVYWERKIIK